MTASLQRPFVRSAWPWLLWLATGWAWLAWRASVPDGYLEPRLPEALRGRYAWDALFTMGLWAAAELACLFAVLRPRSFRRSWGRAGVAAVGAAGWLVVHAMAMMHASPVFAGHFLWLALTTLGCWVLLGVTLVARRVGR